MATLEGYMQSEPRRLLTEATNDGTSRNPGHPRSDDAGNWTGCGIGQGNLVGTFRDISACALSDYLGRPATEQDLWDLTYNDAKEIIRGWWNNVGAGNIPDQKIANLYMHIQMHYGNIHVVQEALNALGENLSTDGIAGPLTQAAIIRQTRKDPIKTYNTIRQTLWDSYSQMNPTYREAFLDIIRNYFPERTYDELPLAQKMKWYHWALIAVGIAIVIVIIYKVATK